MYEDKYDGIAPDTRAQKEKDKDYSVAELPASAAAVVPFKNSKVTKLGATVYSQEYVGSCVPHGFLTQLEYEGIVPASGMSQLRAYRKRSNYPGAGSIGVDMYNQIGSGQSPNAEAPTPKGMTEAQATAMPYVLGTKILKGFKFYQYRDAAGNLLLDQIPLDVAQGKAVSIFIYSSLAEWSRQYVEIVDPNLDPTAAYVRHCICIVPYGDFEENGKQWLTVHDSAAFAGLHLRYISKDFLMKRAFFAAKVVADGSIPPPAPVAAVDPLTPCALGDRGDAVKNLQAFLVKGKYLAPENQTGYYGALTAAAVLWWQLAHWEKFTSTIPELLSLAGKNWGPQSISIIKP